MHGDDFYRLVDEIVVQHLADLGANDPQKADQLTLCVSFLDKIGALSLTPYTVFKREFASIDFTSLNHSVAREAETAWSGYSDSVHRKVCISISFPELDFDDDNEIASVTSLMGKLVAMTKDSEAELSIKRGSISVEVLTYISNLDAWDAALVWLGVKLKPHELLNQVGASIAFFTEKYAEKDNGTTSDQAPPQANAMVQLVYENKDKGRDGEDRLLIKIPDQGKVH